MARCEQSGLKELTHLFFVCFIMSTDPTAEPLQHNEVHRRRDDRVDCISWNKRVTKVKS